MQRPATLWLSPARTRPTVHAYTDASGADRWLAAYLRDEELQWWWTRVQVPERVWELFFDREDNRMGVPELLAIALLLQTFSDKFDGKALFAWCDNFGVVGAIKKRWIASGGCQCGDWPHVATFGTVRCASGFLLRAYKIEFSRWGYPQ